MPDGLLIALIGAAGALLGTVIGAVTTYLVQRELILAQAMRDTHRALLEKQLVALQELNHAIDFAYGNIGPTEGGPVGDLFISIVKDSPKHLAFLPPALRGDGRKLMFEYFSGAKSGTITLDGPFLDGLRTRVLEAIDKTFTEYSSGG